MIQQGPKSHYKSNFIEAKWTKNEAGMQELRHC